MKFKGRLHILDNDFREYENIKAKVLKPKR